MMPRRGCANFGRRARRTSHQRDYTARRTEEENAIARESARSGMIEYCARLSQVAYEAYNE